MNKRMAPHPRPSALVVVFGALVVVFAAWAIGATWGAMAFVAACLTGSILAGLLVTKGQ